MNEISEEKKSFGMTKMYTSLPYKPRTYNILVVIFMINYKSITYIIYVVTLHDFRLYWTWTTKLNDMVVLKFQSNEMTMEF